MTGGWSVFTVSCAHPSRYTASPVSKGMATGLDRPGAMAIRLKNKWHRSERNRPSPKRLEDHATALAFIAWRLALEGAKGLHREGFDFASDRERVGVLSEFVAFQVQLADRLVYPRLGDAERAVLINALGGKLADHMQENLTDIAGPGGYRAPFIELLNHRLSAYAALGFEDGEPAFDFLRYFGDCVLKAMGESQTNRWVLDQIVSIGAPEVVEKLKASVDNLIP